MRRYNRIYAKIDLDAIDFNLRSMEEKISDHTKIIAVIKTDGYGHGAAEIAAEIEPDEKVFGYAVATAEEAYSLRKHQLKKPILILGYTFEEDYEDLVDLDVRPAVYTYAMAEGFSKAAQKLHKTAKLHIKLDTGMSRIGYQITEESADEILKISKLPGIEIEGMFTHFARADELDKTPAYQQMEEYQKMVDMLSERGIKIPLKHCSNSAGIIRVPEANLNAVRAGITIYGIYPSEEVERDIVDLKPVMELKSHISYVKEVQPGTEVSYGGTYVTDRMTKMATVPVGYADGYPRALSGKGWVLVHGKKAPICGRVCMDQFMIDVTDIGDVKMGDEVTLLGKDGEETITADTLGDLSGRFSYELICDINKRVPRIYIKDGREQGELSFFES